ncbi:glyoxylate/hydroxypyruvate reductase A [Chitinimonas prasina]|uniref:Glyoxylate/hydroxypyruvate reductase A n=1 Tax=Chitinimonas prasina TaxID=1434937 RepID=A0ABQ5Y957_9NEIS|nr:glyoxylate/hydroxypyruvate reductase A [Chitinimonas prasina]GLR11349.1 glyoxylate/hydroxypyruvate reductase A [Chitinimonas prasina]
MTAANPLFYLHTPNNGERWQALFAAELPDFDVVAAPAEVDPARVQYLATWRPPEGLFGRFANLRAVFALGAGIDRFLQRSDLAPGVALVRLTDAGMAQQMCEYVLAGVLRYQRDLDCYARQQADAQWQPLPGRAAADLRVTVLGLGEIGGAVARTLALLGYAVAGWSRSPRELAGVRCLHGWDTLPTLLAATDVLVNLLPNTPETHGLLNHERLAGLPKGAALINAGRGEQLEESALLALLDAGHLRGAQLDVLGQEPPGKEHPFWHHPAIVLTPHIAAATLPGPSARQVAGKLRALLRGETVPGLVDRERAY